MKNTNNIPAMNLISGIAMNCHGVPVGMVMTNLPRPMLIAMRDAIDDILEKGGNIEAEKKSRAEQREVERKKHEDAIRAAIDAANEAGFGCDGVNVWDEDDEDEDDDWDEYEDDDEEEEYNPCEDCSRGYCEGCRLY